MSGSAEVVAGAIAAALAVAGAFVAALPWLPRPVLRVLLFPHYRLRVVGRENVPRTGPVLLTANHVTWLDGFFVAITCPRRARFLVNADYVNFPVVRWLARRSGLIPVPATGPKAQKAAIRAAQEALDRGEVVGIFPEAQLSRNGRTGSFLRGLEVILHHREHVAVVPVFLDNLWGSAFSYSGDRTFLKRPEGLQREVGVAFGPPLRAPVTAFDARQAVIAAGVRAFELRPSPRRPPDTLDPGLPRWEHPLLGLLTASTADYERNGIRQRGQKPGTVGQAVPGVALRAVGEDGRTLPADSEGRLQVLRAGQGGWQETGSRGSLDRDGFVRLAGTSST